MSRHFDPERVKLFANKLLSDSSLQFEEQDKYLTKGLCPSCSKRELYISKEKPFRIACNRLNQCGWAKSTTEKYPELHINYSRDYAATPEHPHKTADAYMALDRGFDLSKIRGWYSQQHRKIEGILYQTIRFYLDKQKTRYWERLIPILPEGVRKAHFGGQKKGDGSLYKGDAWASFKTLKKGEEVFIVEGILDVSALHHAGKKAIAALSSNNFPINFLKKHKSKNIQWVLALDGDNAGRKATKTFAKKMKKEGYSYKICLLPAGNKDWCDYFQEQRLTDHFFTFCLHEGNLFGANSLGQKAYYAYSEDKQEKFILDYNNALYSCSVSESRLHKALLSAETALSTPKGEDIFNALVCFSKISNCLPSLSFIAKDSITQERTYGLHLKYEGRDQIELIVLESEALSEHKAFNKALLKYTDGRYFSANQSAFEALRKQMFSKKYSTVESINYVGYQPENRAYVFNSHAYCEGKEISKNEQGFFQLANKGITTNLSSLPINTAGNFFETWLHDFVGAFGFHGLTCLGFWLGSLFACQIRKKHGSFPFLELTGEPNTGKSTLLEFLWKCVGRDGYEGNDIMKATEAAQRRLFSQVSNLPIVIIESDRGHSHSTKQQKFSFDSCKTFFNGRGTGTLGVCSRNNDVEESSFQGTLVISQNNEVDGQEALQQRVVHCHVGKSHCSEQGRLLAEKFEKLSSADVGGFFTTALKNEKAILNKIFEEYSTIYSEYSNSDISISRIKKNHVQVAACCMALKILFPTTMTEDYKIGLKNYLLERAMRREKRVQSRHPHLESFWATIKYLEAKNLPVNHSRSEEYFSINIPDLQRICKHEGQTLPQIENFSKLFIGTREPDYLGYKAVRSRHLGHPLKCYVFNNNFPIEHVVE